MQWVLGHTPDDVSSFISQNFDENLGAQQQLVDAEERPPQEVFMLQLLIRQSAKEAFMQVDSSMRIRKAMLRKTTPLRGPYRAGDLVCFLKKDKWFGPARVLAPEGKSSFWLVHGGVTVLVAETACRPALAEEIYKKQILELRPSRKRRRELILEEDEDEYIPFSDDMDQARHLRARHEEQAPYVDVLPRLEAEGDVGGPGVAAIPGDEHAPMIDPAEQRRGLPEGASTARTLPEAHQPEEELMRQESAAGAESGSDILFGPPPGLPLNSPSMMSTSGQPEIEESPEVSITTSEVSSGHQGEALQPEGQQPLEATPLTQALRYSPERLDGHPYARSSHFAEEERWVFLGRRLQKKVVNRIKKYQKKNVKKAGAGREVVYSRESPENQKKLDASRLKEWTNWKTYTDGYWITEAQLQEMKKKDHNLRVIPAKWVEVDKAETNEEAMMKSRIVVRGDLEDASKMRTDSPTASQLMTSLVLLLAACRDTDLWCGDISAAFLQGSKMNRTLILKMPRDVPDENALDYFVVTSTVYGTKDAPRGWYKNLNATILKMGLRQVPHEQASYVLTSSTGDIEGLLVVHVDDLMWTGSPAMESKMQQICEAYRFGKVEKNSFRYCGREVRKDSTGVTVTCPNLIDRVKPVYVSAEDRPDLSYGVSKLQSRVHEATYEDVKLANTLVSVAQKTKQTGLRYPARCFEFEKAVIVGFQDASFANDCDVNEKGMKLGFRSQSGRLLCLAAPTFKEGNGNIVLLDWHSTTIKRVCRSTLQAESMSLISGMEECEHLRAVLHGLQHEHLPGDRRWQIEAMDQIHVELYTDCRSLEESVNQTGLHTVGDKRLAIDLCGVRQQIWRRPNEKVGDPLLCDRLPEDGTTVLKWISADKMAADCLTKCMKPGGLDAVMKGSWIDINPEKDNGCETHDRNHMEAAGCDVNLRAV